jgi:signal transduction histidine kinase
METAANLRRRLSSVRARSTAAAMAVVALALVASSIVLIVVLQRSVLSTADRIATTRAEEIAADLRQGLTPVEAVIGASEESAPAQILRRGRVVAASESIHSAPPLVLLAPRPGEIMRTSRDTLPIGGDDDGYVVVALGVADVDAADTVLVAQSMGSGATTVSLTMALLAVGVPLLVGIAGLATYVLVGRALRPVEQIRQRTAMITSADLSARVPVPTADDEVTRLAHTMNAMLDRLDQAQKSQRRFVSDASHELRGPLASLRAEIEVAAQHPELTDWLSTVEALGEEVMRLQGLVDSLLTLAKLDERGARPRSGDVDLDDLVDGEVRRMRHRAGLEVTTRIEPVRVMGDPGELGQVIRNLVDNAARHATSRVDVRLHHLDGDGVLEITDDGPGLPADQRARVFDRFVRLDDSRTRSSGGSGLGLSIVRELVEAHGGSVHVDDLGPLRGARLVVRLPLGAGERAQPPVAARR